MSDVMGWFGFFLTAFAILITISLLKEFGRWIYRRWLK